MAKDRARDGRRQFKDVDSLQRMGESLGFLRGNSGMERNPERDRADYTVKFEGPRGKYSNTFYPGAGHVKIGSSNTGVRGIQNKNPRKDNQ